MQLCAYGVCGRRAREKDVVETRGAGEHDIEVQPPIVVVFGVCSSLVPSTIYDDAFMHATGMALWLSLLTMMIQSSLSLSVAPAPIQARAATPVLPGTMEGWRRTLSHC